MWIKSLTCFFGVLSSAASWSVSYELPGDQLAQGQQYLASTLSVSDWYASASFVGNAEKEALDNSVRGYSRAHHKGYGVRSELTYLLGITDGMSLGVQYGYALDKNKTDIDDTIGDRIENEVISEGGTDLTVLAFFNRDPHSTWDLALTLPICSAESVQSVCTSRPATPNTRDGEGQTGGQGDGLYGVKFGLSSNWISMTDQHWFASAHGEYFFEENVYGQKVSAPAGLMAEFGRSSQIKPRHKWSFAVSVKKQFEYSGYSEALQTQVDYGEQSQLALKLDYQWAPYGPFQLKPFVQLAIREIASEAFIENDLPRHMEYTAGTWFVTGVQLSAGF